MSQALETRNDLNLVPDVTLPQLWASCFWHHRGTGCVYYALRLASTPLVDVAVLKLVAQSLQQNALGGT